MSIDQKHIHFRDLNFLMDGRLKGNALTQAERHLGMCPVCSEALSRLERLRSGVREGVLGAARVSDSQRIWAKVERNLAQKQPIRLSWRERFGVSFPVMMIRPALALSVAVLLFVFLLFVFEQRSMAQNETVIHSLTSENKVVMIFKTGQNKMTVIWLTDKS